MTKTFTLRHLLISVVLSLIIGAGFGYLAGNINLVKKIAEKSPMAAAETTDVSSADTDGLDLSHPVIATDYAFDVSDQIAGDNVLISEAKFKNAAWIAIHEDKNGKPGNILGAQFVSAGNSNTIAVELLRPTVSGIYYAMIHEDDGNPDFDYASDRPVIQEGEPIMRRFFAGEEPSEL